MANDLNAIVVQNIEVSPGLEILRVVPDGWEFPDFTPGQFAVLGLPGSAPRCRVCDPEDEVRDPQPGLFTRESFHRIKKPFQVFISKDKPGKET